MPVRVGQLLVASRRLADPNFVRTVVLIVQHDGEDGVLGLVVNRPLDVSVGQALGESIESASGVEAPLHQGGPCPGPLMALHDDPLIAGEEVLHGVRLAMGEQTEPLMRETHGRIKYFAGYAGWSAQQLDGELEEGAWLVADATADDVFTANPETQWTTLMARLTLGQWIDPEKLPEDPSVN